MEKGWVKLHRRILKNSFLMHDNNSYLVFTKLMMLVNQDSGQWAGGRNQLAEWVKMNPNTLKDVLKRLQINGMISTESQKKYSIISIANWSIYQNKFNGGQKKETPLLFAKNAKMTPLRNAKNAILTPDDTPLSKQRSFEDLTPSSTPMGHQWDTTETPMGHHSIKNKKENKEKESDDQIDHSENRRASPETVAKAREKLMEKLRSK